MVHIIVAACVAVACNPPGATVPSRAETEAFVGDIVELARAQDFEALCARGGGNCEHILETAGRDAVPSEPPLIVSVVEVPTRPRADGSSQLGGQVVTVCGVDRHGRPYRTEMLVFDSGDGVKAIEPVYWSGISLADGSTTATHPPQLGCGVP